jgi:hypothetical protein
VLAQKRISDNCLKNLLRNEQLNLFFNIIGYMIMHELYKVSFNKNLNFSIFCIQGFCVAYTIFGRAYQFFGIAINDKCKNKAYAIFNGP